MFDTISSLNEISACWKSTYDVTSSVHLRFRISSKAKLCLNDTEICSAIPHRISYVDLDAEHIEIQFEDLSSIRVFFTWPEDEPPQVASVQFYPN